MLELEAAEEAAEEAEEEGAEEASELAEPLELKADDKMSLLRSGARTSMRPKT